MSNRATEAVVAVTIHALYSLECGSLLPRWVRLMAYIAAKTKAAASCRTPKPYEFLRD
jgi:hypothetical protein